jgi:hypothetical protein
MSAKVVLQLNAAVGLASTAAAGALMSMVMSDPTAVAAAIARHEYGAVAMAMAQQLAGWLHALLRFI